MLDSEGWAVIYGGGFSVMDLYSRVKRLCAARVAMVNCVDGDVSICCRSATIWQRMKTKEGIDRGTREVSLLISDRFRDGDGSERIRVAGE